jgi:hypothetical protein
MALHCLHLILLWDIDEIGLPIGGDWCGQSEWRLLLDVLLNWHLYEF